MSTFLNKVKLKDIDLIKIMQKKAKVLKDGKYIQNLLCQIIKSKENVGKNTTEKLEHLNSYIQSIIVELNLFYKIHKLIEQINQGVEVEINEKNINQENNLL